MTLGVHPPAAKHWTSALCERMRGLLKHARKLGLVSVGECGPDYEHTFSSPRESQKSSLRAQIELAAEFDFPLYLHDRGALAEMVPLMRSAKQRYPGLRGVVHCFTGKRKVVQQYLDMGFYIGVTVWVCDERRNADLVDAQADLPLDRLMIESDAPYLTPRAYTRQ